ncbi:unnamed protein product [Coffea canephora]|uniref:Uncharacterized protein n=1 Tax=Coffea canephora TaxID=49390 RepID=A0A068V2A6_COFCA|nr:unnamed protein product [Coffea canephora]
MQYFVLYQQNNAKTNMYIISSSWEISQTVLNSVEYWSIHTDKIFIFKEDRKITLYNGTIILSKLGIDFRLYFLPYMDLKFDSLFPRERTSQIRESIILLILLNWPSW